MQWKGSGRFAVLACAAALLAACGGVHLPDTQAYVDPCPAPRTATTEVSDRTLFFVSTSLPDCRRARMRLAPYRYTEVSYGMSVLPAELAEPWKRHQSARYTADSWHAMLDRSLAGRKDWNDHEVRPTGA